MRPPNPLEPCIIQPADTVPHEESVLETPVNFMTTGSSRLVTQASFDPLSGIPIQMTYQTTVTTDTTSTATTVNEKEGIKNQIKQSMLLSGSLYFYRRTHGAPPPPASVMSPSQGLSSGRAPNIQEIRWLLASSLSSTCTNTCHILNTDDDTCDISHNKQLVNNNDDEVRNIYNSYNDASSVCSSRASVVERHPSAPLVAALSSSGIKILSQSLGCATQLLIPIKKKTNNTTNEQEEERKDSKMSSLETCFPMLQYKQQNKKKSKEMNVNARTYNKNNNSDNNDSNNSNNNSDDNTLMAWVPYKVISQLLPHSSPSRESSHYLATITSTSSTLASTSTLNDQRTRDTTLLPLHPVMFSVYELQTMKQPPKPQALYFEENNAATATSTSNNKMSAAQEEVEVEVSYMLNVVPHPNFGLGLRLDEVKTDGMCLSLLPLAHPISSLSLFFLISIKCCLYRW